VIAAQLALAGAVVWVVVVAVLLPCAFGRGAE